MAETPPPPAELKSSYGAHQKKFNEDRPISLVGKCRPMRIFARNIKCMLICAGVPCVHVLRDRTCARIYVVTYRVISVAGRHHAGRLAQARLAAGTPTVLENKAAKLFEAQI